MNAKAKYSRQVRGQMMFLTWVNENYPDLYQAVLNRVASQQVASQHVARRIARRNKRRVAQRVAARNGLGQTVGPPAAEIVDTSWWAKAAGAFTALGTTYLGLKNQRDVLKINLERAKQGLPPISNEDLTAPIVQTRVDLSPEVMQQLTAGAGLQINKVLMFAGVGLLAFMLMRKK